MGEVLPRPVRKAYHLLRDVAVHYMTTWRTEDLTFEDFATRAERGHVKVMEYARQAQRIFGVNICTYNLHTLACRGHKQEISRGPAGRETEFWLERKIQELKQRVKYRAKNRAEVVLVNDVLDSLAISRLKSTDPRNNLKTIEELVPRRTVTALAECGSDVVSTNGEVRYLGASTRPTRIEARQFKDIVKSQWEDNHDGSGWVGDDIINAEVTKHTRCIMARDSKEMTLYSEAYKRSSCRMSHYVLVTYDEQGRVCQYVAKVTIFLQLKSATFSYRPTMDLAIADLFVAEFTRSGTVDLCPMLVVNDMRRPAYQKYPVKVEDIKETLIVCLPNGTATGYFIADNVDEG